MNTVVVNAPVRKAEMKKMDFVLEQNVTLISGEVCYKNWLQVSSENGYVGERMLMLVPILIKWLSDLLFKTFLTF